MTRDAFLLSLDEVFEVPAGTLKGPEKLDDLENWNSMAMLSYIALVDSNDGTQVSPRQIRDCSTVDDLVRLAKIQA